MDLFCGAVGSAVGRGIKRTEYFREIQNNVQKYNKKMVVTSNILLLYCLKSERSDEMH